MNTKILYALNFVLLAAVAFLFYKGYGETANQDEKAPVISKKAMNMPVTSRIAFIHSDSINEQYLFIKEKRKALEEEEKRFSAQIEGKAKALQTRFLELQQKAATMSQQEAEAAQLELQQKEQEISELRYKMAEELEVKRANLQKDFFGRVNNFLAEYNKSQQFDYILSYAEGGQVLLAKDTLDITSDVLNGLNKSYTDSKNKKK